MNINKRSNERFLFSFIDFPILPEEEKFTHRFKVRTENSIAAERNESKYCVLWDLISIKSL